MIDRIKALLMNDSSISGYKIIEINSTSDEFFFITKNLDMNRAKDMCIYQVTVYKNFDEKGKQYTGSSTVTIHPTMNNKEMERFLKDASFAAGLVKNEYYPLAMPCNIQARQINDLLPEDIAGDIIDAAFKADHYNDGRLNSAEFFINRKKHHIVNSNGVDVSYECSNAELEFIAEWKKDGSSVEQYRFLGFSEFIPDKVTGEVDKYMNMSRERAEAKPTPTLNNVPILLTGEPVKTFFSYYYSQVNAEYIYNHFSIAKQGESIQGDSIKGDLVTLSLIPDLKGSTKSSPYDNDGYPLSYVTVIKDGRVERLWGDVRHCHYLGIEPTGKIENMKIEPGTKSIAEMKCQPYLELLSFSDFQMDDTTGDFAGEIRLGRYFDGKNTRPVTGGSISGNIRQVQGNMHFSKEIDQQNNFIGPKTILLFNASLAGAEK
jgi:PmbA protein